MGLHDIVIRCGEAFAAIPGTPIQHYDIKIEPCSIGDEVAAQSMQKTLVKSDIVKHLLFQKSDIVKAYKIGELADGTSLSIEVKAVNGKGESGLVKVPVTTKKGAHTPRIFSHFNIVWCHRS